MMRAWLIAGLAVALFGGSRPLAAQQVVRGKVVDSLKMPLADVDLVSGPLQTKTGADGRFLLSGFPIGTSRLILRRVGYAPVGVTVTFYSADTLDQNFTMLRATALDTVSVRADSTRPGDPTFERRRSMVEKTGFGKILDEAYLARAGTTQLGTILSAQLGFKTITSRGKTWVASRRMAFVVDADDKNSPCFAQIYVDGVRVYHGGPMQSSRGRIGSGGTDEPPNIDLFSLPTIHAIEIYRGASDTPSELSSTGAACGTIAIWTKR